MVEPVKHPSETPEYWEALARDARRAAAAARNDRHAQVESIRIHERNAAEYDETARRLRSKLSSLGSMQVGGQGAKRMV